MKDKKLFLKAFLKNPLRTGSVIQSSSFLADKMIQSVDFGKVRCIVELGCGGGVMTKNILKKMPENSKLISFEIDSSLAEHTRNKIRDSRLVVINDTAENIGQYLHKYGMPNADYIISSLPLVSLPKKTSINILRYAYECLGPGGQYIQFQYSLASLKGLKQIFSAVSISFVFLNLPPAFVYVCTKI
ncbi:MAG: methyltransferase domain-containing protein [Candidatus Moranbacteria bacterium]|nr:methyltransferase domain-containing protein [Candidatus Moranbacteria bacterium]